MSLKQTLEKTLRLAIPRHEVPGATMAVLRNNKIIATAAAGVTSVNTRVPVTDDTLFQIGSITKPFTATLIMQLIDQGRLSLDEPVQTYLPEFRVADLDVSRRVTIRHLLSHQSGIDGDLFIDSGRGDDAIQKLLDKATMVQSLFEPTTKLSYCNLGFVILGRIIEVVTQKTWDQALKEFIFKPLQMSNAFSLPEDALKFSCAIGHLKTAHSKSRTKKDKWYASNTPYLSLGQKAAGATPTMTATDLLKFAALHLRNGKLADGTKLLSARSAKQMRQVQFKTQKHSPYHITGWGLSWMLMNWQGEKLYGHDGATIGQNAYLRIYPKKDIAVSLLTNGGDTKGLFDEMFNLTFNSLAGFQVPPMPSLNSRLRIELNHYLGVYANQFLTIEITQRSGKLRMTGFENGVGIIPELDNIPLGFIDKSTACANSGDKIVDRSIYQFSEFDGNGQAGYVQSGLRQFRRVRT